MRALTSRELWYWWDKQQCKAFELVCFDWCNAVKSCVAIGWPRWQGRACTRSPLAMFIAGWNIMVITMPSVHLHDVQCLWPYVLHWCSVYRSSCRKRARIVGRTEHMKAMLWFSSLLTGELEPTKVTTKISFGERYGRECNVVLKCLRSRIFRDLLCWSLVSKLHDEDIQLFFMSMRWWMVLSTT